MREHVSTKREKHGPENMALMRSLALALLQKNSADLSIDGKRARVACNLEYLFEVLLEEKIDIKTDGQKMVASIDLVISKCKRTIDVISLYLLNFRLIF